MENESFGQRVKRKTVSIVKKTVIVLVVLGLAVFSFFYWATFESGIMAGKVLRLTEKGILFKTYEGKLNLETFGALKGASPIAESFDFSVESNEKSVIKALQEVALSGERVFTDLFDPASEFDVDRLAGVAVGLQVAADVERVVWEGARRHD